MKNIALIGSTGSIGRQVLNVVRRHSDKYNIVSLSAGSNVSLLKEQIKEFNPKIATSSVEFSTEEFTDVEFFFGENAFVDAIIDADVVVVSLVGFKGILAVLRAIDKGIDIALANKESLVVGGDIVTKKVKEKGVNIFPIDSEHSAIWQVLNYDYKKPFKNLILTASGGAFRDFDYKDLKQATALDALKHPNWTMGNKITIDCATLVNKAFEVIEAKWLYDTTFDNIKAIIHRESIIHSMVEFEDNSVLAQMSYPTMEIPITVALNFPQRIDCGVKSLDFAKLGSLTFSEIDDRRFPCFKLVLDGAKKGGGYPAVINGANEQAVKMFLNNKISYFDIYKSIDMCLNAYSNNYDGTFESLNYANEFAVNKVIEQFGE